MENLEQILKQIQETILSKISDGNTKLSDLILSFQKINQEKDNRIIDITNKYVEIVTENDSLHAEMSRLQSVIKDQEVKIMQLKTQKKQIQDMLMGASIARDQTKKELEDKTVAMKKLEDDVSQVAGGSTGIALDLDRVAEYFREKIIEATRSLRMIIPSIDFLRKYKLLELFEKIPSSCNVNIALSYSNPDLEVINPWKTERKFNLTVYNDQNLIGISANSTDMLFAFTSGMAVSGFYTNIPDLVKIFAPAMMHPFLKGIKF